MTRVYGEPVEVQVREDGRPARFGWRGRRYTVRAVLGHWVVNREWWRDPRPEPERPEMRYWRVEAAAGRDGSRGTYDLRRDMSAGTWTLRRIAD